MSGKAIRETVGFVGVIASLAFVGLEIRQNTVANRAAAYQAMGYQSANIWYSIALEPGWAELVSVARDSTRWDSLTDADWYRVQAQMTGSMRSWETIYRQVEGGLLPSDAMTQLGWGVNYWPEYLDRIWPVVRSRLAPDFAEYVEEQLGIE